MRNGESPIPDAETIARQLVARAPFEVADLHTAPKPTYHSYVNFENWLWVPAAQWHDVSVSLSVGGATVTLTAKPSRVHWSMGTEAENVRGCRGNQGGPDTGHGVYCSYGVDCYDAGRAWTSGTPENAKTSCSYTYKYPSSYDSTGHVDTSKRGWTITGQFYYDVGWTCTGNCSGTEGDLGEYPARTTTSCLTVYERQVVNTSPGYSGPTSNDAPSLCP